MPAQGTPSSHSGASSAGAVFGTLSFLARAITGCRACIQETEPGKIINVFGAYDLVQPETFLMLEYESQALMQVQLRLIRSIFEPVEASRKRSLRRTAGLVGSVPFR